MTDRMRIEEFVEKYKKTSPEKVGALLNKITGRRYIPIVEKKYIYDGLLERCVVDMDGVKKIDWLALELNTVLVELIFYTKLDTTLKQTEEINDENTEVIEEDDRATAFFEYYDMLKECGALKVIREMVVPMEEREELEQICEWFLRDIEVNNSMAVQVGQQVTRFGEIIGVVANDGLGALANVLENLDESKIEKLLKMTKFMK